MCGYHAVEVITDIGGGLLVRSGVDSADPVVSNWFVWCCFYSVVILLLGHSRGFLLKELWIATPSL